MRINHVTIPTAPDKHPADQDNVALCAPTHEGTTELMVNGRGLNLHYLDPSDPAKYGAWRKRVITSADETVCTACDYQAARKMGQNVPDVPKRVALNPAAERPICPVCLVYGEEGQSLVVCEEFGSPAPGGGRGIVWPAEMTGKVVRENQPRSGGHIHLALTHYQVRGATACLCVVGYKMQPPVEAKPAAQTKKAKRR